MRSSISVSEREPPERLGHEPAAVSIAPSRHGDRAAGAAALRIRRATWQLLIGCAVIGLAMEAAARVGYDRSSKIQRRTVQEYARARAIGSDGGSRRHLLVVGNSLLDEGVDFERVQRALDGWDARRYMVEQTYYYDWYYGLRRLFHEGARPDVVAVMLSVGHWIPATTRGDYSAQYLFDIRDLPAVAADLHLHPTQATDLLFAGVSKFWAVRAELRTFVIRYTMPNVGRLMSFTQPTNRPLLIDDEANRAVSERIARLKSLVEGSGAQLVLLLPPLLDADDGSAGLLNSARRLGVSALRPVSSGAFGPELYRDGFHLNKAGAAQFTERLIAALRPELESGRRQAAYGVPVNVARSAAP